MYCKSVSWWIGEPHLRILCPPEKYLMHQSAFYQRGRLWSCSNVSSRLERSKLKFILIYWQLLCLLAIDTKFLNFRTSTLTHSKGYMTISVEEGKQAKCNCAVKCSRMPCSAFVEHVSQHSLLCSILLKERKAESCCKAVTCHHAPHKWNHRSSGMSESTDVLLDAACALSLSASCQSLWLWEQRGKSSLKVIVQDITYLWCWACC